MYAMIEDHDVIVAQTMLGDEVDVRVIFNEDEAVFYTVWKRANGVHQVMWRGNLEGCLKEFRDIVGDVAPDYLKSKSLL